MKKFRFPIYIALFLVVATAIWYFGHYRANEKIQKVEPTKVYKTTTPVTPDAQTIKLPPTESVRQVHSDETDIELPAPPESVAIDPTPKSTDTIDDSNPEGSKAAPLVSSETAEAEHPHSPEEIESDRSKQLRKDAAAALEEAAVIQKQAHIQLANRLSAMPVEKQVEALKTMKEAMLYGQHPVTQEPLFERTEEANAAWKAFFNGIIKAGYTPPRDFE